MSNELSLNTLAVEIDSLHDQANYHAGTAVVYAAKCGQKLNEAKEQLGNDKAKFTEWLGFNSKVKIRQAYNYINLSKAHPKLLSGAVQLTALPSVQQAIELLNAPEEVKEQVNNSLAEGEKVSVAEINQLKRDAKEKEALIQKIRKQRDDWKANGKTQIDNLSKRIAEADAEKAKAINVAIRAERENTQEQIRTHKRAVNLAKVDMDKLKLKHKKSIDDEVKANLGRMQIEIDQKQYKIDEAQKRIDELAQQESELNVRVGAIARHNKAIAEVKSGIEKAFVPIHGLYEDNDFDVPDDIRAKWLKVSDAVYSMADTIFDLCKKMDTPTVKIVND